jgi:Fe-S-cluster containining protein
MLDARLVPGWLEAARNPGVVAGLRAVYAYLAAAVESRGPACWASGRCCNFDAAGHRLYATGLEAAYTLTHATGPLTPVALDDAIRRGGCPFQERNLCGLHPARPLGCRVYFCDRSAQGWQRELSERALAEVRAVHTRHGVEYRYAEWRSLLGLFIPPGSASK